MIFTFAVGRMVLNGPKTPLNDPSPPFWKKVRISSLPHWPWCGKINTSLQKKRQQGGRSKMTVDNEFSLLLLVSANQTTVNLDASFAYGLRWEYDIVLIGSSMVPGVCAMKCLFNCSLRWLSPTTYRTISHDRKIYAKRFYRTTSSSTDWLNNKKSHL